MQIWASVSKSQNGDLEILSFKRKFSFEPYSEKQQSGDHSLSRLERKVTVDVPVSFYH